MPVTTHKDTLTFHLALRRSQIDLTDESYAFSKRFVHSLGLKVHSGSWSDIDLDSPVIHDFLEKASGLICAGDAVFFGFNFLSQQLVASAAEPCEWYLLQPKAVLNSQRLGTGVETVKAYTLPANVHATYSQDSIWSPHVSERFKAAVEEGGLTGTDFLWVRDTGKYRAAQWFIPIALKPMGRGVDHPWFDPSTLKGPSSWQPTSPGFRTGVWQFDLKQLRENLHFEDSVYPKLFDLYRESQRRSISTHKLTISSYRRFLRDFLPDTDFAFVWYGGDGESKESSLRRTGLCLNETARRILLERKIITDEELEPIAVLDAPPEGCALLDGTAPLPGPAYTPADIEAARRTLAPAWRKHLVSAKPIRTVSMLEAVRLLRKRKRLRPADFSRGLGESRIASLKSTFPGDWLAVLRVSDGGSLNDECLLLKADEFSDIAEHTRDLIADAFDDYPYERPHVPVAMADNGDWYSLEMGEQEAASCRVSRVSHEDLSVVHTWDSIAMFIFDMLTGFYD
jgi:hypothetical protein